MFTKRSFLIRIYRTSGNRLDVVWLSDESKLISILCTYYTLRHCGDQLYALSRFYYYTIKYWKTFGLLYMYLYVFVLCENIFTADVENLSSNRYVMIKYGFIKYSSWKEGIKRIIMLFSIHIHYIRARDFIVFYFVDNVSIIYYYYSRVSWQLFNKYRCYWNIIFCHTEIS